MKSEIKPCGHAATESGSGDECTACQALEYQNDWSTLDLIDALRLYAGSGEGLMILDELKRRYTPVPFNQMGIDG